ncbi:hypothetical protein BT63DRAFT_467091 [Microthyrium microscopicum]|uniref:Uncharacterized protein n=1 Tax=Microthyrium microscopicum TaxID=703497 RepID=A0A6A6UR68_9PEZI|nr:hypothetical protein BT63DRAFT_467091 [Microthyrium microscopicum]
MASGHNNNGHWRYRRNGGRGARNNTNNHGSFDQIGDNFSRNSNNSNHIGNVPDQTSVDRNPAFRAPSVPPAPQETNVNHRGRGPRNNNTGSNFNGANSYRRNDHVFRRTLNEANLSHRAPAQDPTSEAALGPVRPPLVTGHAPIGPPPTTRAGADLVDTMDSCVRNPHLGIWDSKYADKSKMPAEIAAKDREVKQQREKNQKRPEPVATMPSVMLGATNLLPAVSIAPPVQLDGQKHETSLETSVEKTTQALYEVGKSRWADDPDLPPIKTIQQLEAPPIATLSGVSSSPEETSVQGQAAPQEDQAAADPSHSTTTRVSSNVEQPSWADSLEMSSVGSTIEHQAAPGSSDDIMLQARVIAQDPWWTHLPALPATVTVKENRVQAPWWANLPKLDALVTIQKPQAVSSPAEDVAPRASAGIESSRWAQAPSTPAIMTTADHRNAQSGRPGMTATPNSASGTLSAMLTPHDRDTRQESRPHDISATAIISAEPLALRNQSGQRTRFNHNEQAQSIHGGHQARPNLGQQARPTHQGQQSSPFHHGQQARPTRRGQQASRTHQGQQAWPDHRGQHAFPTHRSQVSHTSHQGQQAFHIHQSRQAQPSHQGQQAFPTHQSQQSFTNHQGHRGRPAHHRNQAQQNRLGNQGQGRLNHLHRVECSTQEATAARPVPSEPFNTTSHRANRDVAIESVQNPQNSQPRQPSSDAQVYIPRHTRTKSL